MPGNVYCVLLLYYILYIQFLLIKKHYDWERLNVRYGKFPLATNAKKTKYKEGVVITPFTWRKPKHMLVETYSLLMHPFTLVFIYFYSDKKTNELREYEYDKDELLECLYRWKGDISTDPI